MITAQTVYGWFRELIQARRASSPSIIHVSEACGCLRKAYYDRVCPAPKLDIMNVMATLGNGVHYQLQKLLKAKGWQSEVECKLETKKITLTGHADLVNPENEVVELKTCNKTPDKPYPAHELQLNAYLIMLKARKGYIIYISRDGRVRVFDSRPRKDLFDRLVKRAYYLHFCLLEKKAPKPERGLLCEYCPYKWKCLAKRGER